jgi:3-hydroxyanthranilate 3,4-dioxygenase
VGLVIERERRAGELDGLQWYCERCDQMLYEERFELTDIESQFPPVFERFFSSLEHRSCRACGSVMERPA